MSKPDCRLYLITPPDLADLAAFGRALAHALEAGADYVAFGAFFPTTTKDPKTTAEPEILTIWQETMQTPCVAIGGITVDNCRALVAAGADFIAVSAGVWAYPDGPAEAVRR